MAAGGMVARPSEPRVSTGIASLDAMLEGGLVARRPYLIVGPSGTGKTTMAIQFLCEGVRRGERVLLVTLEEPPNEARVNHRGLDPNLSKVEVFDAIPDIMRYERTPFKDIASVRYAIPFREVPLRIRQSPELASVEVTITALEQMLRTEVIRKGYTRLVVDSLTALQYFCMKGFDPVAGAQSFLRFLSDLRVTTLLTVESPLEDIETPERSLARGEIRLFRWELDGQTVRAVGVEKFRGSSHDVRLHPYRIGPQGIDINLEMTISRDTRQIIEPIVPHPRPTIAVTPAVPAISSVTPLVEEVRDLILLGADVEPARTEIEAALAATVAGRPEEAQAHLSRVSSLVLGLVDKLSRGPRPVSSDEHGAAAALQRVVARVDSFRTGAPPTTLPPPPVLQVQLGALLSLLPPAITEGPEAMPPPARPPEPAETAPEAPAVEPVPIEPSPAPPTVVEVAPSPAPPPAPSTSGPPSAPGGEPVPLPAAPSPPPVPGPAAPAAREVAPAPPGPPTESAPPSAPVPPAHTLERPAKPGRGASARAFPPPPKPRPSVPGVRAPKPAPVPTPRSSEQKEAPPPLPTGAPAGWAPPPPTTPVPPAETVLVASPPKAVPEAVVPAAVPVAPATPKRRRKATPASGGKRTAPHPRASATHPTPAAEPAAPPHPTPPPEVGIPEPPPTPPAGEAPLKSRRRAPRKRKAPPVVSVTVEPIPPGVFGSAPEGSPPDEGEKETRAPEG